MKSVTSRENSHYQRLLRLIQKASERRQSGLIVLDGPHLVQAYVAAHGSEGVELFVRESAADSPEIRALREAAGQTTICLSDRLFDAASPVETPTGILALAPVPVARDMELGTDGMLVLIDGVQDPGNLGSILRSAAAAGASAAWVSETSADPWSPKCLRGGMGAHFHLMIRDRVELTKAVQETPFRILAGDSMSGESLYEADLSGPIAIIVGAEGRGVSPELLAAAHARIRIPMEAGVESLNAAAAAAVMFFEWKRRRGR
jgi:TrmH family RNA methyltransferase